MMATALLERNGVEDLFRLKDAHRSCGIRFTPEDSPFSVILVDVTHRCNMNCRNCYIPVRDLPDLPADYLYSVLARLPRRTRIRLVGAEPTVRSDLPAVIGAVRRLGHIPVVLSNGLRLGRRAYVRELKLAGLRTLHLSMNGGLCDDLYWALDGMRCAARKLMALDTLLSERMNVTVGMVLAPGVNDGHLREFLAFLLGRGVRDIHLRSVGAIGQHLEGAPFTLDELEDLTRSALPAGSPPLDRSAQSGSSRDFELGRAAIQLTAWPDLGSAERGRLTPDGYVEPFFESAIANEFRY
jgi:molybdenum cofactor biosynthesis enzyme MoaA